MEEEKKIFLKQQLRVFRDKYEESLSLPSTLSNVERKYVHKVAGELNLVSKSAGSGDNRFITIWKHESSSRPKAELDSKRIAQWTLPTKVKQSLKVQDVQFVIQSLKSSIVSPNNENNLSTSTGTSGNNKKPSIRPAKISQAAERLRAAYYTAENIRKQSASYEALQSKRQSLPAFAYRDAVTQLIQRHQIVLVSGETGCGKSTQVPQYLLEDSTVGPSCRIVITQPRRISAVSLAERVAYERNEAVGTTVGYNIRFDAKQTSTTQLLFVTGGVLLRKLLDDPDLDEFSHVIIDEAHERDKFTEFLLIILRDICLRRPSLKLVLMSATMHTTQLLSYFDHQSALGQAMPQINVGGSVYPVQEFYLEHVLKFIQYSSALLQREGRATNARHGSNNSHNTTSYSAKGLRSYQCAVCQKAGFLSAEELGTHAALCYPADLNGFLHSLGSSGGNDSYSQKQMRLQQLEEKLCMLYSEVKPYRVPGIALNNDDDEDEGRFDRYLNHKEEEEEGEEEGADLLDLVGDQDSASEASETLQETENEATDDQLPDRQEIGQEKYLLSEESAELSNLLKQYQQDLEACSEDVDDVDYDLVVCLTQYIVSSEFGQQGGHILIFLQGWDDISILHRLFTAHPLFQDEQRFLVLQLHSGIPRKDQQLCFLPCALPQQRKIILSTNIAETSVTIDDITVVIDCGKAKEKTYDMYTKLSYLRSVFISRASARQRKGRAGRTRAGTCFRLYSLLRSKHLKDFQDSELLRMPLDELVLQAKGLGVAPGREQEADSVTSFLLKALDPPPLLAIQQAIALLQNIHCLDTSEQLTEIGQLLSRLPMTPRLSRMLLMSCMAGCGSSALSLGAALSYRSPFLLSNNTVQRSKVDRIRLEFSQQSSCDAVAVLKAVEIFAATLQRHGYQEARRLCDRYELSFPTMNTLLDTGSQLDRALREVHIQATQGRAMRNVGNLSLVTALLAASGLYPDIAVRYPGQGMFSTEKGAKAKAQSSSLIGKLPYYRKESLQELDVLSFQGLVALNPFSKNYRIGGPSYLMQDIAPVSLFSLLVFAGSVEIHRDEQEAVGTSNAEVLVSVDKWIQIRMLSEDYQLVVVCRDLLSTALLSYVRNPELLYGHPTAIKMLDRMFAVVADSQAEVIRRSQYGPSTTKG